MNNPLSKLNLATCPAAKPMLEVLVHTVMERFSAHSNGLGEVRLLLPNRRSCLSLRDAFLRLYPHQPMLMPDIAPLGQMDEAALWAEAAQTAPSIAAELMALPPACSAIERLFAITREIWQQQKRLRLPELSMQQAARHAQDVIAMMDELDREQLPYDSIFKLNPDAYADRWRESLVVLAHILRFWPPYLANAGRMNPLMRRNALLDLQAKFWREHPPTYAVIAAGSTGTHPATAALLRVIAGLPNGLVILPGLDKYSDDAVFEASGSTHPQYQLKQLLGHLGATRSDVAWLDDARVEGAAEARMMALQSAMLPAEHSHRWRETVPITSDITRLDCEDEWQEAQAIVLLLREVLEVEGKTAALITHDEALMRRVSLLFARYGVALDSASGRNALEAPWINWLMLVAEAAAESGHSLAMMALLKHSFWQPACDKDRLLNQLERKVFRGIRSRKPAWQRLEDWAGQATTQSDEAQALQLFLAALKPLVQILGGTRAVEAGELVEMHWQAAQNLAVGQAEMPEELTSILGDVAEQMEKLGRIETPQYHSLLRQSLQLQKWFPLQNPHPRLHMLSPIEARLQQYDRVILAGMNEGSWPHEATEKGWLNEAMRSQLGLPPISAHIGQEAHDFWQLAASPELFITRSKRSAGSETLPSRWLERLDTYLGIAPDARNIYSHSPYLDWVRDMAQSHEMLCTPPPAPCPPLSARPVSLSLSQVDRWMHDPYGLYAAEILKLKKLDDIDREMDAASLGSILHEILEAFVNEVNDDASKLSEAGFVAAARHALSAYADRPQVAVLWLPRLTQMAQWVVEIERERRQAGFTISAEMEAQAELSGLTLRTRIDRMENKAGSVLRLVDYKSGTPPSYADVKRGYACQLPLEALIWQASHGQEAAALEYWKTGSGVHRPEMSELGEGTKMGMDALLEFYRDGLARMAGRYAQGTQPYWAIPVPKYQPKYNDYAQLARIQEWFNAEAD